MTEAKKLLKDKFRFFSPQTNFDAVMNVCHCMYQHTFKLTLFIMKQLSLFALLLIGAFQFTSCNSSESSESAETETAEGTLPDGKLAIDTAASTVTWKGVMLGVKEHFGKVALSEAEVDVTDGKISGGHFTVNLSAITPEDTVYNEEQTKDKLIGHLQSPDFFNVAEHPTATFDITGSGEGTVTGNLTIRGITREETVKNVEIHTVGGVTNIKGDLTFNRKNYEVSFDVPVKDMVISDDVELQISLVAAQ